MQFENLINEFNLNMSWWFTIKKLPKDSYKVGKLQLVSLLVLGCISVFVLALVYIDFSKFH